MSMLARTRFFLVKLFLLLISIELNDRVRAQSATEGGSRVPDCPLNHEHVQCTEPFRYNSNTSRAVLLVVLI